MNVCNIASAAGDLGIANARIIALGDSAKSFLLKPMKATDNTQMPPLLHSVSNT